MTDLDVDDVIIRASLKGKQISKEVINGWFRGVFSSEGDSHVPSWDKLNNAVVAERDGDGFLSEEKFQCAWFIPDVQFDKLSFDINRLPGPSSYHVYLAKVVKIPKEVLAKNLAVSKQAPKQERISYNLCDYSFGGGIVDYLLFILPIMNLNVPEINHSFVKKRGVKINMAVGVDIKKSTVL